MGQSFQSFGNIKNEDGKETKHLMEQLKNHRKQVLSQDDLKLITMNLVNRKRFMYTVQDIVSYVLKCICLRNVKFKKFRGNK